MLLENTAPVSDCAVVKAANSMSSQQNSEIDRDCKLCASSLITSQKVSNGSEDYTARAVVPRHSPRHEMTAASRPPNPTRSLAHVRVATAA